MDRFRGPSVDIQQVGEWAADLLKELGVKKDMERRTMDGLDPYFLSFTGLSGLTFRRTKELAEKGRVISESKRKRVTLKNLEDRPKRGTGPRLYQEAEDLEAILIREETDEAVKDQSLALSQIDLLENESPRGQREEEEEQGIQPRPIRSWSWKREARRRPSQRERNGVWEAGESSSRAEPQRRLDFH